MGLQKRLPQKNPPHSFQRFLQRYLLILRWQYSTLLQHNKNHMNILNTLFFRIETFKTTLKHFFSIEHYCWAISVCWKSPPEKSPHQMSKMPKEVFTHVTTYVFTEVSTEVPTWIFKKSLLISVLKDLQVYTEIFLEVCIEVSKDGGGYIWNKSDASKDRSNE